jgi:hypothetical protein
VLTNATQYAALCDLKASEWQLVAVFAGWLRLTTLGGDGQRLWRTTTTTGTVQTPVPEL